MMCSKWNYLKLKFSKLCGLKFLKIEVFHVKPEYSEMISLIIVNLSAEF